jgi:uridine kinase
MPAVFPEGRNAIRRIQDLAQTTSPVVVALDGRSGTGKSTLAEWMAGQLGGIRVDQDDFYSGGEIHEWQRLTPQEKVDRVIDWSRVRDEVLLPLRAGRGASWRPFNWGTMIGLSPETITAQPSSIVILDGAYSARPELGDLIDLSILVTLDDAVRRERLRQREGEEIASAWHPVWDEAEDCYFGTIRPPEAFDLVISRPSHP